MSPLSHEHITWPAVTKCLAGLAIFFLLVQGGAFWVFHVLERKSKMEIVEVTDEEREDLFLNPNSELGNNFQIRNWGLKAELFENLERYRAIEKMILESYGWVDREKRIIRVPIDYAMDLIMQNPGLLDFQEEGHGLTQRQ